MLRICRIWKDGSADKNFYGQLAGLAFEFDGYAGTLSSKESSSEWMMRTKKSGTFRQLDSYAEYELLDGAVLRRIGHQGDYTIDLAPFQPATKKAKKLMPCKYGAACYMKNEEHRSQYSHPASDVNEQNRARMTTEHSLVSQVMPDWDQNEEEEEEKEKEIEKPQVDECSPTLTDSFSSLDGAPFVLAFPSISTGVYQFDGDKAMTVLVDEALDFLSNVASPNMKLVLCDMRESPILLDARSKWASRAPGTLQNAFSCAAVDLTKPGSLGATAVVNSTNKLMSAKGSGLNLAIYSAIPELQELTKKYSPPAETGMPMVVSLPDSNGWSQREGRVRAVIHIVGPNMNPKRDDSLRGDYSEGCLQLALTYRNVFRAFYNLCHPEAQQIPYIRLAGDVSPKKKLKSTVSDNSAAGGPMDRYFKPKFDVADLKSQQNPKEKQSSSKKSTKDGGWSTKLYDYCKHPELHQDVVVWSDNDIVIIRDVFPKSLFHFLVMPREIIPTHRDLNASHVSLLRAMQAKQSWLQKTFDSEGKQLFRCGFHAVPSMKQVHMHVISQDFSGDALKHKKHWNSFNTAFFIEADQFIGDLEDCHAVAYDKEQYEAMLKQDLKCHRCRVNQPTIPKLKAHIAHCGK